MSERFLHSAGTAAAVALILVAAVPTAGQSPTTPVQKTTQAPTAKPSSAPPSKTAAAKNWTAPRTPWGHPDLQGLYSNSTIVPLERPANMVGKAELTEAEVKERFELHRKTMFAPRKGDTGFYNEFWWEWGKDGNRTSLIIDPPDGKIPWAPAVQAQMKARGTPGLPGSWVDMNILDRCITRSMPGTMMPGFYGHYYRILQTSSYVAIQMELLHDVRIIPLDNRPHVGQNLRQWLGDSRGHWEGDTLVVETTNMTDKLGAATSATFFSVGADLKLTERFRRVDGDTIDYRFTVEAPSSFTKPWTAAIPLWKTDEQIFEYACHEGNRAMPNSLSGARAEEAAQAAATGAKPR